MWRDEFGQEIPLESISHVCGIPLRVSTDCPRGRLYLEKGVFHVNPSDCWNVNDFQSTLNRHREKVPMKTDEPTYRRLREDHLDQMAEYQKSLEQRVDNQRAEIARLHLEIHRLDSEKQTEACCTGEMREDFQREIQKLHWENIRLTDQISYHQGRHYEISQELENSPEYLREHQRAERLYQRLVSVQKFMDEVQRGEWD